jgi:hypothetical protein
MLDHNELTVFIWSSYTHIKYKNKETNIACHTKLLQHSSSCWSIYPAEKKFVCKIFKLKKNICLSICTSVGLLISQFLFHLGWQNIIYTYTKVLYRCRDPILIPYSCTVCCLLFASSLITVSNNDEMSGTDCLLILWSKCSSFIEHVVNFLLLELLGFWIFVIV